MSEQAPQSNATVLLELGDRVRRSWWTVIAGICLGLAGGRIALQHMPKVYEAKTRIWISEQEISERVVKSTVKDDMALKLAAFRDAVLAEEYMIELIERTYGMPANDEELTARMGQIRSNVSIDPVRARRLGVQAFSLGYQDTDPRQAARVVNMLTRLYVSQNADLRKKSAVKVAGAIHGMADKAKAEFDSIDEKLTRFKQAHPFETELHLSTNLRLLESRKRDIEALSTRRDLLSRDKRLADEELAKARSEAGALGTVPTGSSVVDPLTQQIAMAKRELENLRVRYTDGHPEVQAKRRELDDLLAQARNRSTPDSDDPDAAPRPTSPLIVSIEKRIRDIESEMIKINSDEAMIQSEIREYERRINVMPETQRRLTELEEEHSVAQEKWRRLEREAEGAEGSIDLEETNMAEGMEILTEAGVPSSPIKPEAKKVYLAFLIAGVVLFVGPMLARQALNPPIASETGLRSLTEIPVLVSIPQIMTPANRGSFRRNLIKNLAFSVLAGAVLLSVKFYT